jgi:hypothetical protein
MDVVYTLLSYFCIAYTVILHFLGQILILYRIRQLFDDGEQLQNALQRKNHLSEKFTYGGGRYLLALLSAWNQIQLLLKDMNCSYSKFAAITFYFLFRGNNMFGIAIFHLNAQSVAGQIVACCFLSMSSTMTVLQLLPAAGINRKLGRVKVMLFKFASRSELTLRSKIKVRKKSDNLQT